MANPIVYFEVAGPDQASLTSFFKHVFGWDINAMATISADSTGGIRGGIRQDPAAIVLYVGVDDIKATLALVEANGGKTMIPRTVVPNVVTFALYKDPAGNVHGLAENGSFPQESPSSPR